MNLKFSFALSVCLLLSGIIQAQTPRGISDHSNLANQKACYEQSMQYAKDLIDGGGYAGAYTWSVTSIHYSAKRQTCLAWLHGSWYLKEAHKIQEQELIVDAFEKTTYAATWAEANLDDNTWRVGSFQAGGEELSDKQLSHLTHDDAMKRLRVYAATLGFFQ